MESEKLYTAWQGVCTQIKSYNNIDSTQFNAFFSRLHPQAMSDGFLMLTSDNEFIKTWIERHYMEFIRQALLDLYKIPFSVVIEVDAGSATEMPRTEQMPNREDVPPKAAPQQSQPAEAVPPKTSTADTALQTSQTPEEESNTAAEEPIDLPTSLLTFESFVIGDSNRMAYSMAVAVAETPGKANLNPLFIYGKSGLGKTHLLRAIQNYVHEALPHLKTIYVDSAVFLNEYMEAGAAHDKEKSSYKNFRMKYEEADILLIDDVQYLQGKTQTLNMVFNIFNKLKDRGKQIVLSSDRAPKNIDIDERYKSRFNSGGTFDIQPPEIETKLGIVKSAIDEYNTYENMDHFTIPEDIQTYIAETSGSNIRDLKSAVTTIIYQMTTLNQPNLDIEDVKRILENHFSEGPSKRLSIADIQKEVEQFYRITHAEMVGNSRPRNITNARQVAIYLCRRMLDLPYNDIGKKFNRDHSTVMYSVTNMEEKLKGSRELREEIEAIKKLILEA